MSLNKATPLCGTGYPNGSGRRDRTLPPYIRWFMTADAAAHPFRLTRLRVQNFRSIADLDLELGPLTVLVGPNGSGKSNIIDALRFLRDCLTRGLDQATLDRGGVSAIQRWTPEGEALPVVIGVTASNLNEEATYDVEFRGDDSKGFLVHQEELRIRSQRWSTVRVLRIGERGFIFLGEKPDPNSTFELLGEPQKRFLGPHNLSFEVRVKDASWSIEVKSAGLYLIGCLTQVLFYLLNPVELRPPQRLVREAPLDEKGQNLVAILRQLRQNEEMADSVRSVLSRLIPGVVDFSVEQAGSYLVAFLHYHTGSDRVRKSDLALESDGTLHTLGILTALYAMTVEENEPSSIAASARVLAFEEPESNIHPGMLAVLAELFEEASLSKQILLTTHSPELLDFLPVESFRVVEKVNGETRVGPLATDQAEIVRQKLFTPGELLRNEGLHRQPAPDEAAPAPDAR